MSGVGQPGTIPPNGPPVGAPGGAGELKIPAGRQRLIFIQAARDTHTPEGSDTLMITSILNFNELCACMGACARVHACVHA